MQHSSTRNTCHMHANASLKHMVYRSSPTDTVLAASAAGVCPSCKILRMKKDTCWQATVTCCPQHHAIQASCEL
jgi:hypothetical protein